MVLSSKILFLLYFTFFHILLVCPTPLVLPHSAGISKKEILTPFVLSLSKDVPNVLFNKNNVKKSQKNRSNPSTSSGRAERELSAAFTAECIEASGRARRGFSSKYTHSLRSKQARHLFPHNFINAWQQELHLLSTHLQETFIECAARKSVMTVRVLLSSVELKSSCKWNFTADTGVYLYEAAEPYNRKICASQSIIVELRKNGIFYNGKKRDLPCIIVPISGHIEYNGTTYDGSFIIYSYKDSLLCINCVDLEQYVYSVLKTESWPGWPLEVNKVFAIACRSYVVSQAQSACKTKKPFHVKNSNEHQTYRGKHETVILQQAVDQTRGVILGFDNKPVLAMFDSCCGGVVPAHSTDFDFTKAPYLARDYACTFCAECSLYSWKHTYTRSEFKKLLQQYCSPLRSISHIRVVKDTAGIVKEVIFYEHKKSVCITGKQLYSLIKAIKSFCFDIQIKGSAITISGRGFGHHIGLCQWGVREMVRQGWNYKSILRFYYPGTGLMKVT